MKVVAVLRIVLGVSMAAAGEWHIGDQLAYIISQIDPEPRFGLDGPPPLGFQTYGGKIVFGLLVIFAGLAIVKGRWWTLSLIFWFYLGTIVSERVHAAYFGWAGLRWDIDYIGRGVWFLTTPDFAKSIDYFGGAAESFSMYHASIIDSLVNPLLGLLLIGAVVIWRSQRHVLPVALVIATSFLIGGLLQFFDVLFDSGYAGYRSPDAYVIQEGFTFCLCVAGLLIILRRRETRPLVMAA